MKKKDMGIIIVAGIISGMFSMLLSGMLFTAPEDRSQSVEVVEPISTEFEVPDSTYFNSGSINPSRRVQPGQEPNSKPFESVSSEENLPVEGT